jgi:hypothetical protein
MKFRTRPFEIEAVQFNKMGDHAAVIFDEKPTADGKALVAVVKGHQGFSQVNRGDWIIAEPDGQGFYPCDPDTFARKYEPAD